MTGADGRLGRALLARLRELDVPAIPWRRPDFDLDDPAAAARMVARDRPRTIIHAAAWTDVDGCARDPATAMRRNARAVREMAEAAAASGAQLVVLSTNEVFDGRRTDGQGYRETDPAEPANPYGASKLAGERAAVVAFSRAGRSADLWVVRTAWLFGAGAPDFPAKILAAADRLAPGEALPVVADEVGSPTYAPDLAAALLDVVERAPGDLYHLVNAGRASRLEWARAVLARAGRATAVRPISQADFARPSRPPRWAVLATGRAAGLGVALRPWGDALAQRLAGDV
ncbi:MAG: SDR family oxidoreductase [Candidatus Limnocylindrales bacterium]